MYYFVFSFTQNVWAIAGYRGRVSHPYGRVGAGQPFFHYQLVTISDASYLHGGAVTFSVPVSSPVGILAGNAWRAGSEQFGGLEVLGGSINQKV